jgi:hypothetical protein
VRESSPRHLAPNDPRFINDDRIAVVDRGLLVLLYGQTVSRIVHLTIDDIIDMQHKLQLRLGPEPVDIRVPLTTCCAGSSIIGAERQPWVTLTSTLGYFQAETPANRFTASFSESVKNELAFRSAGVVIPH